MDDGQITELVTSNNSRITSKGCTTVIPLIDDEESYDSEVACYICPYCGKNILAKEEN